MASQPLDKIRKDDLYNEREYWGKGYSSGRWFYSDFLGADDKIDKAQVAWAIRNHAEAFSCKNVSKTVRKNIFSEIKNCDIEREINYLCFLIENQCWDTFYSFINPKIISVIAKTIFDLNLEVYIFIDKN